MTDEQVEDDGAEEAPEAPKQTISRMPPDIEAGPKFPSGMSAPEAAMAGATANLTDEQKEKIQEEAKFHGLTDAALVAAGDEEEVE